MKYIFLFIKKTLRYVLMPFSFVPALLVMLMIFTFSAQDGATSSNISYKVSHKLVQIADRTMDLELSVEDIQHHIRRIHRFVRKMGHFTEYFILAVSLAFPLYVYGLRGWRLMLIAGTFCVGFAALDEYHQSFVAGRGPSLRDVGIDSLGIFAGIFLVRIVCWTGRKTIFKPLTHRSQE